MNLKEFFAQLTLRSILDISLVAMLLYQIIAILKGTRAAQILIGMLVIFIAYILSSLLEFETLNWIISKFYSSFIIVVIVLFQDDIRRLLTRFGRSPFVSGLDESSGLRVIDEVVSAAKNLSHDRIGAIIVFERSIGLERLYDHSVRVDALVSEQLLVCIFQSFSPLHDGAVIVQKNRLSCASAHLPLSKNQRLGKKLGTRHSAAVGISEETDAVVLVVSEETGTISLAWEGALQVQNSAESARRLLVSLLLPSQDRGQFARAIERSLFRKMNAFSLRIVNMFRSRRIYLGNERRRPKVDRRYETDSAHRNTVSDVELENKLASTESRLSLRFPSSSPIKIAKADGTNLILSSSGDSTRATGSEGSGMRKGGNRRSDPLSFNRSGRMMDEMILGTVLSDDFDDEIVEHSQKDRNDGLTEGMMENEALKGLVQLGPEDKFNPPDAPIPPPQNVSIGGVSLEPPLVEPSNLNNETKRR
jgi:diadenylate cyclase